MSSFHHTSKQPLVSIITIVFNGEKDIRQTMESVLQQSYGSVEYIVIDGGSTDGTVSILEEFDSQLTYWRSAADNGISDAFNKGINVARGEIIGLINAGDWYESDTVQCVVDAFLADKAVGVVCGALQFWKGSQPEYLCSSVPELLEREMSITHPTCFVLTDLYKRFGMFSDAYKLAMDYELLLRLKCKGAVFVALDTVLANMQHDGISEENWKKALQETHRARTELLDSSFFTTIWYYYFLILKRGIRVFLEKLGFDGLLHFYRNRLALVKKTKS
jgi:glycosyltransferase involved in cell wall biosynthesis